MPSKSRKLSRLITGEGFIKNTFIDSDALGTSANKSVAISAGTSTYTSSDTLPSTANNGDQALVTSTNRLYIYSGSGWYNIALVNTTPYFTTSPSSTYDLSTTGAQTNIELLAVDSEGVPITYSAITDSDFDSFATITKDSDNGRRFTVTLDSDASTSASGTVTFRASDGVNIATALSTFSVSFIVSNSYYTTLLLKADSDADDNQVDSSVYGATITEIGTITSTALSPYHPGGYSTYFNGSSYITFAETGDQYELGVNTNFTIEMWVYATTLNATNTMISQGTTNNTSSLSITSAGEIYLQYYAAGSNRTIKTTSGAGITTNKWYHIAMTHEASNSGTANAGKNIFYVNGTEVDSVVNTSYAWYNSTDMGNMEIGRYQYSDTNYFTGYVKDLRITKSLVYTGNFTAPTTALTAITNCELLCMHMPYIVDGSTNDTSYAIGAGTPSTERFGPNDYIGYSKTNDGGSIYMDSTVSYAKTTDSTVNSIGNASGVPYTIEFWMRQTAAVTAGGLVCKGGSSSTNPGDVINIEVASATNKVSLCLDGAYSGYELQSSNTILNNIWYHVALVKNTSNLHTLYIDGISRGTYTSGSNFPSASSNLYIGAGQYDPSSAIRNFNGYIADLRISNVAVYNSEFTPPTSPVSAPDSDTVLHTCTNKNNVWDESSGAVITKTGNATASATQTKFATSSAMYFDGTGDHISAPTSRVYDLAGSIAWTIEGWFYWNSVSGEQTLIEKFTGGTGPGWSLYKINSSNALGFYSGSSGSFSSAIGTVTTGQWYHVAVTRDAAGTTRGFLNGTLNASGTYSIGNNSTGNLYVGARNGSSNYFNGYVQDIRITKGLARYTAAFTPPTSEFNG